MLLFADLVSRLNTRRFVHGRGTDREEATIPTFVMVANTIHRARPTFPYPQRDVEREGGDDDSVGQQKVSVAPESDKVVVHSLYLLLVPLAHSTAIQIPQYAGEW
jgi:hypothetical protein